MKKLILFSLALLVISSCAASSGKLSPRTCPAVQAGYVSGTLDEYGNTILEVVYPCPFAAMPVLTVSPAQSEGTLRVVNFSANSLTGAVGSIQVQGLPNMPITFAWFATMPTP